MKILHTVEFYYPSLGGMQEVVKQLSERLVKLGHEVTVATTFLPERKEKIIHGVHIAEFDISGNFANGMQGEIEKYKDFLLHSNFDIITNFAAQQWATDIALPLLDKLNAKKVFVPTGFSGLFNPVFSDYFEKMKSWMKHYDKNVFLSDNYRDINFARENKIENCTLIANGAAADEFDIKPDVNFRKQMGISEDAFLVLHVGSYTGVKGHREAVEIFLRAGVPKSYLLLVGDKNKNFEFKLWRKLSWRALCSYLLGGKSKIKITELSRALTVQAYLSADLFLFPSNIECSPIVLFESMAAKTPFLTSDVGNAAEIITWSSAGKIMPTEFTSDGNSRVKLDESAKLLYQLAADKTKLEEMKTAGYIAWKENFSWEIITQKYLHLYQSLLASF